MKGRSCQLYLYVSFEILNFAVEKHDLLDLKEAR